MSFSSNVNETRSLFGLYAIMGTPMVMSFDIRDDTLLLPRWEILTNEEVRQPPHCFVVFHDNMIALTLASQLDRFWL